MQNILLSVQKFESKIMGVFYSIFLFLFFNVNFWGNFFEIFLIGYDE